MSSFSPQTAAPTAKIGPEALLRLVQAQRAHRSFTDAPVADDVVARCLRVAIHSPSSENLQPWVFVVVRNPARRDAIARIMAAVWADGGRDYTAGHSGEGATFTDVDRALTSGAFATAPVMIVIGGDTNRVPRSMLASSVFPAVQNLLLAATAEGLGSALTTIATLRRDELAAIVEFPAHVDPVAVVPLGWPARQLGPSRRTPFAELTSRDRYGAPWETT